MPDKSDFGLSEWHEAIRSGERVLIRGVRPEDKALYPDFLGDVSAEDLRLRFFARIAELSATGADKLSHLDYTHEIAFIALDKDYRSHARARAFEGRTRRRNRGIRDLSPLSPQGSRPRAGC